MSKMRKFIPITSNDIEKLNVMNKEKMIRHIDIKTDAKYIYLRLSKEKVQTKYKKPIKA